MSASDSSGIVFSNRVALQQRPHHQPGRRTAINSIHGDGVDGAGHINDDVNCEPQQRRPVDRVVMRNRVIDLDKNRIKCNRNRIWPRPSSFLSFFKQSLGSPGSGGSVLTGGGASSGSSGDDAPQKKNAVPSSESKAACVRGDAKRLSTTVEQKVDLDMIRKLEEEIYKRGREQHWDEEAKDFNEFYFNNRRRMGERKTFTSDTSAFNGDQHRPVLLVDPLALEPLLLRRSLSADENGTRVDDGESVTDGPAKDSSVLLRQGASGNKSIIIVDNSEYYPVLMRYDINADQIDRHQQQQQQFRRQRTDKLKIDTTTGTATTVVCQPNGATVAPSPSKRPLTSRTVSSPVAPGFPMKNGDTVSSPAAESARVDEPFGGGKSQPLYTGAPTTRPPVVQTAAGGVENGKKQQPSRTANLFQRFLQQRRSLNLSVRRKKGRPQHECPHFKGPLPSESPFRRAFLLGDLALSNGTTTHGSASKAATSNKVKFEYLKRLSRYDCDAGGPHRRGGRRLRRAISEPNLISLQNWKSDGFVQHLQRHQRTLHWSTGDLAGLGRMVDAGKNFENIFDSTSDHLSARLSAVVMSSSSSSSVPLSGSGSLSSSTTTASSMGSTSSQRALQRRLAAALLKQSHHGSKPPLSSGSSSSAGGAHSGSSNSSVSLSGGHSGGSSNILRKKSSSFRGVLRRSNTPDVVNTWVYRKR